MKNCCSIVLSNSSLNNRCGKEAVGEINGFFYCQSCMQFKLQGDLDYIDYYLNAVVYKLNDIHPMLPEVNRNTINNIKLNIEQQLKLLSKIK